MESGLVVFGPVNVGCMSARHQTRIWTAVPLSDLTCACHSSALNIYWLMFPKCNVIPSLMRKQISAMFLERVGLGVLRVIYASFWSSD